ncbi:hypothetical protein [Peribacillus simplex]|uniref:hypothetical protein n=1 Tax=Peribacillus simplex TaxID=1478 RepID=UPI001E3158D5|nr:hypothetical protein [Peribacillus simplex]MDR4929578.1 hypothetical protein [Peribacillus simplex]WHX90687.1 hypothetical protein QNH50_22305 [Peribacillus simplex]
MDMVFHGKINLINIIKEPTYNMKFDYKKRKIQMEYREKLQQKRKNKKFTLEAIVVAIIIFLFIVLNSIFKAF